MAFLQKEITDKIVEEIIFSITADHQVERVVVGPRSSMVTSRTTGVACNLTHGKDLSGVAEIGRIASRYQGGSALSLAKELLARHDMVCRATAIAALNSLVLVERSAKINGFEILSRASKNRRVAMVGHFNFTDRLRAACGRLDVLELEPGPGDIPAVLAPDIVPKADIVAITGTTLVNGTIDGLLELVNEEQLVMVLGPTTPMSKVLFGHKVDVICGVRIDRPGDMAEKIASGVSFRDIRAWEHIAITADENMLYKMGVF